MAEDLRDVAQAWTDLGASDPMGASLTTGVMYGHNWDTASFLATGTAEINRLLQLLTQLGIPPRTGTAVDFGCGPGRLSAALAAAGFRRVIGIDVSATMLATARRLVPNPRCEFRLNSGTSLQSIDTDTADLVYSCRVLQHLPPVLAEGYVREFLRIARPGAPVVFQLPAKPTCTLGGMAVRLLPERVLNRLRRGMQMHGIAPVEVVRIVARSGGVTVSVEDDDSAGPRWRSYLYIVSPSIDCGST